MNPSVPRFAVSSRRPAPKPAIAPKSEPRRSASETSVTSTRSAVPPSGAYAERIETCTSTATKSEQRGLERVEDHGAAWLRLAFGTSTITDWSESRSTNGCTWICLKRSMSFCPTLVTVPIRMLFG